MKMKALLPLLVVSAAFVTPVYANWFHNPTEGINRNIGSAPNPTPADIREMRQPIAAQKVEVPVKGYTVIEPAKDTSKSADAAQPAPAQGDRVAAAAPSR